MDMASKVGSECLGFEVRLLSRVITSFYDEAFAELGLKITQFSLLNAIANRPDNRPAELAKSLEMDESTLSRNVARMCARGWLRLEDGGRDRRSHQITLTEKGMTLLKKSYPAWRTAQSQVARKLGSEGVTALKSLVKKLHS
jgi:DNA-binding MarR family transcriptional regulator